MSRSALCLALLLAAPAAAQLGMSDRGAEGFSFKPVEPPRRAPFPGEVPPIPGLPFTPHAQAPSESLRPGCPVEREVREGGLILQVFRAVEPGSPRGEMLYLSVLTAAGYVGRPVAVEYRIAGAVSPAGGNSPSLVRIPVSAPGTRHEAQLPVSGFIEVQAIVTVESHVLGSDSLRRAELSVAVPAARCR